MSARSGGGEEEGTARQRRDVLDDIRARVRLRFALDAGALAERVLSPAGPAPGVTAAEHAKRLSLDDLYLATACAAGEEAAWEELGARHFPFLHAFARRVLPAHKADDVADQVIADLWQRGKIARFDGRSSLRTWLGVVVTRAALNALKAQRPMVPVDAEGDSGQLAALASAPRPASDEAARLLARLVPRALAALSADDKLLLLLHYEQGLTLDQIGRVRGGSKASLSRRLARIRTDVLRAVEEIASRELGTSAAQLWGGADPHRIELDLAGALAGPGGTEQPGSCAVQEV